MWLIGGTSESASIASSLADLDITCIVTTVTENARTLYNPRIEVAVGGMNLAQMSFFCQQNSIAVIVDASHPYATEVSRQAIALATQLDITYLRYERVSYQSAIAKTNPYVVELNSFAELLAGDYLAQKRVLLTIGCNALPQFQSWHDLAILFARVLPKIQSLEIALASGFTSDRLIALRPPIDEKLEAALWQQWGISLVVTKASGKAGGEDIKRKVAADLQIPLIVITRPQVDYPQQTGELREVLDFCKTALHR